MCGRFTLTIPIGKATEALMGAGKVHIPEDIATGPRYNVAPTQNVASILNDGSLHVEMLRWGLVPAWAKEESIGSRMINARAETLAEKPSFKRLLHSRRCLIIADGFYEWRQETGSKSKTPMYITLEDHQPFALAGLWDSWRASDGQQLRTCTIITTEPNELVASIHNRMPVILPEAARELWLDTSVKDDHALQSLLVSYNPAVMSARPVSRQVNDPRQDSAELIA